MAVINCPECNGKVSKFADFCPHCGINKKLIESILIQKQKEKQEILDAQEVERPEEINKTKKIPIGGGGLKTPLHDRLLRACVWGIGLFVICPSLVSYYLISNALVYRMHDGTTINLEEHPLGSIYYEFLKAEGFRGRFRDDPITTISLWLLASLLYILVYEFIFRLITKSRSKEKSKSHRTWR